MKRKLKPLPNKKQKWFQIIYFNKSSVRPARDRYLYASKKDFLEDSELKESDFHWIKLIKLEE